ncbi:MAG: hypothetical protein WBV23_00170, partial [Desulfobaccales bacterium]
GFPRVITAGRLRPDTVPPQSCGNLQRDILVPPPGTDEPVPAELFSARPPTWGTGSLSCWSSINLCI